MVGSLFEINTHIGVDKMGAGEQDAMGNHHRENAENNISSYTSCYHNKGMGMAESICEDGPNAESTHAVEPVAGEHVADRIKSKVEPHLAKWRSRMATEEERKRKICLDYVGKVMLCESCNFFQIKACDGSASKKNPFAKNRGCKVAFDHPPPEMDVCVRQDDQLVSFVDPAPSVGMPPRKRKATSYRELDLSDHEEDDDVFLPHVVKKKKFASQATPRDQEQSPSQEFLGPTAVRHCSTTTTSLNIHLTTNKNVSNNAQEATPQEQNTDSILQDPKSMSSRPPRDQE